MTTRRQKISRRNKRSSTLGRNSELIPVDLIFEILSRLSVKFVARCRCVSKLWGSIIRSAEFRELILTRSVTTQPQLLFACVKNGDVFLFSSPQPQNPDEKASPIAANYHMSFAMNDDVSVLHPVHGLICLKHTQNLKGRKATVLVICNPSTGQLLTLPRVKTRRDEVMSFFGYDPIDKQFKLLSMTRSKSGRNKVLEEHQVLTLGNGELSWRMIECTLPHYPLSGGICINGVLYYPAWVKGFEGKFTIACFDIRSEKFSVIEKEGQDDGRAELVNYKGKLAIFLENWFGGNGEMSFELCVLEDVEKHEWLTHTYVIPPLWVETVSQLGLRINGVTRTGEIVLSTFHPSNPFSLMYYNLERSTLTQVQVQGMGSFEDHEVHTFVNHEEDVNLGGGVFN